MSRESNDIVWTSFLIWRVPILNPLKYIFINGKSHNGSPLMKLRSEKNLISGGGEAGDALGERKKRIYTGNFIQVPPVHIQI